MANEDARPELEVVADVVDAWTISVEDKDLGLFRLVVDHDPNLVWIGSGENDWLKGYEKLEDAIVAQTASLENISIGVSDEIIHLSPDERFAWVTNRWVFEAIRGDQEVELPLRCTWILEKRDTGWVLVHFHQSVGADG
jgi:ketosteroid isomerase-like protein